MGRRKRFLLATVAALALATLVRYGPAAVSYAIVPPERGHYRYYLNGFPTEYWEYLVIENGVLVSCDFRTQWFDEDWELEPVTNASHTYWRRDYRGEFDGTVTFSRTSMTIRDADGREERYNRVLDLWEVWGDRWNAASGAERRKSIAAKRQTYTAMIESRRIEQGLAEAPSVHAPGPNDKRTGARESASTARPVVSVVEYRGLHSIEYPLFALYADGKMVWLVTGAGPPVSFRTQTVADAAQTRHELAPFDESVLSERYELSNATDQNVTFLWIDGKKIEIYGPWRKPRERPLDPDSAFAEANQSINASERHQWGTLPPALHAALTRIDELRMREGQPWLPEKIEVTFSDYENAPDPSIVWPAEWPGLYHPTSRKHGAYSYSVFVPSADFGRLREFLATRKTLGAVMIDLNKMAPEIRFPFPGESAWRN